MQVPRLNYDSGFSKQKASTRHFCERSRHHRGEFQTRAGCSALPSQGKPATNQKLPLLKCTCGQPAPAWLTHEPSTVTQNYASPEPNTLYSGRQGKQS